MGQPKRIRTGFYKSASTEGVWAEALWGDEPLPASIQLSVSTKGFAALILDVGGVVSL